SNAPRWMPSDDGTYFGTNWLFAGLLAANSVTSFSAPIVRLDRGGWSDDDPVFRGGLDAIVDLTGLDATGRLKWLQTFRDAVGSELQRLALADPTFVAAHHNLVTLPTIADALGAGQLRIELIPQGIDFLSDTDAANLKSGLTQAVGPLSQL